jgi:hypothetical protein
MSAIFEGLIDGQKPKSPDESRHLSFPFGFPMTLAEKTADTACDAYKRRV